MPSSRSDDTPSLRALKLFSLLLFSGRSYTLHELARKMDCAKSTVLSTMRLLERHFPQLFESRIVNKSRTFSLRAPGNAPRGVLSSEGLRRLYLCTEMAASLLPGELQDQAAHSLRMAATLLDDYSRRGEALSPLCLPRHKGSIDYTPHVATIDALIAAIDKRTVCTVTYAAPHHAQPRTCHLGVMRLVSHNGALYAEGYLTRDRGAPEQGRAITLCVHRIQAVAPLRLRHGFSELAPPAEYFGFMEDEPFSVTARFAPEVACYVAERVWSAEQETRRHRDGSLTLTFTAQSRPEVVSWLLGFGDKVRVLRPRDLLEELLHVVERMLEQNQAPARPNRASADAVVSG